VAAILAFLQKQNNLIANVIFAIGITVVIGGVMSVLYGYIYTIFGPPRYGPTDAPPPKVKAKRYKR
jgi:ABC-type xylose transport system permease subunit